MRNVSLAHDYRRLNGSFDRLRQVPLMTFLPYSRATQTKTGQGSNFRNRTHSGISCGQLTREYGLVHLQLRNLSRVIFGHNQGICTSPLYSYCVGCTVCISAVLLDKPICRPHYRASAICRLLGTCTAQMPVKA